MISNVDWIALIVLIFFVFYQTPFWNGSVYRAMPMWLEYIGSSWQRAVTKKGKMGKVTAHPLLTIAGQIVFSLVWFIIYSLMVATGYLVYTQPKSVWQTGQVQAFFGLFIANMILNKCWSPIFFGEYYYYGLSLTGFSQLESTVVFIGGEVDKEKTNQLTIKRWNMATVVRIGIAAVVALLIAATTLAMLGLLADLLATNVITDTATRWVSMFALVIYSLWSLLAVAMNVVVGCCVFANNKELSELKAVTTSPPQVV